MPLRSASRKVGCNVGVLGMESTAQYFQSFRLYIIKDGMIAMKGGEGPMKYNVKEVGAWLENAQ